MSVINQSKKRGYCRFESEESDPDFSLRSDEMEQQENGEINLETCCLKHCPQLKTDTIFGTKGSTFF